MLALSLGGPPCSSPCLNQEPASNGLCASADPPLRPTLAVGRWHASHPTTGVGQMGNLRLVWIMRDSQIFQHYACLYTQVTYILMKALFVELPFFERYRQNYLDDDAYRSLQSNLLTDPRSGALIVGTGGLRKLRFGDDRRGKGKRGGIRVIYFWWESGQQFWLFTLYDKDEVRDLTAKERVQLKATLLREIGERNEAKII